MNFEQIELMRRDADASAVRRDGIAPTLAIAPARLAIISPASGRGPRTAPVDVAFDQVWAMRPKDSGRRRTG